MENKIKNLMMELYWHDCSKVLPKEEENPYILMTDGEKLFPVSYKKHDGFRFNGYLISPNGHFWCDIVQTTRGFFTKLKEKEFE